MKKSVAVVLCLLLALSCIVLPACGSSGSKDVSNSKYVGTWKAVSMTLKDEVGEFDEETILILKPDGTATFSSENEESQCNWEETKDGFKLTGGAKMTFTDDGDGIKSKILGVELHFERVQ